MKSYIILLTALLFSPPAVLAEATQSGGGEAGESGGESGDAGGTATPGSADEGGAKTGPAEGAASDAVPSAGTTTSPATAGGSVAGPASSTPPPASSTAPAGSPFDETDELEDGAKEREEHDHSATAESNAPAKRGKHCCSRECAKGCAKRTHHRLTFMLGGALLPMNDASWSLANGPQQTSQGFVAVEYWPHARIGVQLSGGSTRVRGYVDRGDGEYSSDGGFDLEMGLGQIDLSARVIPTPVDLPIRAFARAGGGLWYGLTRLSLDSYGTRSLDVIEERGAAPYALVGGGVELGSPRRLKKRLLPAAAGLLIEGGLRLGGGGEEKAAPSIAFGDLGRLDIGAPYLRIGVFLAI